MPKTKPIPDLCQFDKNECTPKHQSKKDTRHWCKGKVGTKHKVEWRPSKYGYGSENLTCIVCEKVCSWWWKPWRKEGESDEAYAERCATLRYTDKDKIKAKTMYYLDFV